METEQLSYIANPPLPLLCKKWLDFQVVIGTVNQTIEPKVNLAWSDQALTNQPKSTELFSS